MQIYFPVILERKFDKGPKSCDKMLIKRMNCVNISVMSFCKQETASETAHRKSKKTFVGGAVWNDREIELHTNSSVTLLIC